MNSKIGIAQRKSLSDKQKHVLNYWNTATSELENTSISVLNVLYQNDDIKHYLLYQGQFHDFKTMRNTLLEVVERAIESNHLPYMEKVVINAVRQLKNMITFDLDSKQKKKKLNRSVEEEYNLVVTSITECMAKLRKKLDEIGLSFMISKLIGVVLIEF